MSNEQNEIVAKARYIRKSPNKLRRAAKLVRGKSVKNAVALLDNLNYGTATILSKVIQSAASNAEHNNKLTKESLVITRLIINKGPSSKRHRPRARGRIFEIEKQTSHIEVGVKERVGKV